MSEQIVKENKRSRKKTIIMLVSIVLAVTVAVAGTLAYLFTRTDDVVNEFHPAEVTCKVEETFENNIKSNVSIKNTSNIDAFIRVAVVTNWVDTPVQPKIIARSEADRAKLSLEKTNFIQGEEIKVTATGSGMDWIGIYPLSYPSGYDGASCIRYKFVKTDTSDATESTATVTINDGELGGDANASGDAFYNLIDLPTGEYIVALMLNDQNPGIISQGFAPFYENGTVPGNVVAYTKININNAEIEYGDEVYGKTQPVLNTDYSMDTNLNNGWVLGADGYYYYTNKVAPGANTSVLINECKLLAGADVPEGYTLMVNIIPSAIQASPDYVVGDLWGAANSKVNISASDGVLTVTDK